jgi:hypothetical protein
MNRNNLKELYEKYNLTKDDIFKHQHYVIITRTGIEKIEAQEKIQIAYKSIKSEPNFAVVQAFGTMEGKQMETFGSAYKGATFKEGNTNTWYVTEMAEKRAFSRFFAVYYNLTISVQDDTRYGNNVALFDSQTKEEREAKKNRNYLGNGRVIWTDGNIILAEKEEEAEVVTSENDKDLPF